jgi:hypothetical protein
MSKTSKNVFTGVHRNTIKTSAERLVPSYRPVSGVTRRVFLRNLTVSAASLMAGACGGGGGGGSALASDNTSTTSSTSSNTASTQVQSAVPVWDSVPTITFTEGVAASFSIATFVSDADNDVVGITKNQAALPAGVTYDPATRSFVYDGIGAVSATSGHVLTATEG